MIVFNTPVRYSALSKGIHWLSAFAVYGLFAVGLWMVGLDYYDPWYHDAPFYHKSVGILLFVVTLCRILLRVTSPPPRPIAKNKIEQLIALSVQWFFYIALFIILFSGYCISTEKGQSINVFGWFSVPAWISGPYPDGLPVGEIHLWGAYIIVAFSALHIGAGLKHHFIEKDNTLKRMWFFSK